MNRQQRRLRSKAMPYKDRKAVARALKSQSKQNNMPPEAIDQLIDSGTLKEIPSDEVEFAKKCGVEF